MSPIEALMQQAQVAHFRGELVQAETLAVKVIRLAPDHPDAQLLLAVLAAKGGRDATALSRFDAILDRRPDSFEARFWRSNLLRRGGNLAAALEEAERAARLRPGDAYALNNLGLCAMESMELPRAISAFRDAVKAKPDLATIHHNLGTALQLSGRDDEAARCFQRAVMIAPQAIDSWLSLGQAHLMCSRYEEAKGAARMALKIDSQSAKAHLILANAAAELGQTEESDRHLAEALELDPEDANVRSVSAMRLQAKGEFASANEHLDRSLEIEPNQGFAHFAFVFNNPASETDEVRKARMETLVRSASLPPTETMYLHYALGRMAENHGEFEDAMRNYDLANQILRRLRFGDRSFDAVGYRRRFEEIRKTFDAKFMDRNRGRGSSSQLPVLLVGMMRSGTTLMEQILSSHPNVSPGGENPFWFSKYQQALNRPGSLAGWESNLRRQGHEYLESLEKAIVPPISRVTDKMPANVELLGPILAALPNARVIHMRRHPADTCLSIYATPNRAAISFAGDRDAIASAYRCYLELMDHWRRVLPANRLLDIDYESLVSDPESTIRKVLEFIELDWDPKLLQHELNARSVLTPSLWQVRRPIYSSSVGRWKSFEPYLGPFRSFIDAGQN